jgi:uncharacterized protein
MSSKASTALHRACEGNHTDVISLLLAAGADIEYYDLVSPSLAPRRSIDEFACCQGGRNALHIACSQGSLEAVSALLGAGANIEARNVSITTCVHRTGWTPLHHACESGRETVVTVLLEADADVRARDKVRLL